MSISASNSAYNAKVRRGVIRPEHLNQDSVERADRRHRLPAIHSGILGSYAMPSTVAKNGVNPGWEKAVSKPATDRKIVGLIQALRHALDNAKRRKITVPAAFLALTTTGPRGGHFT